MDAVETPDLLDRALPALRLGTDDRRVPLLRLRFRELVADVVVPLDRLDEMDGDRDEALTTDDAELPKARWIFCSCVLDALRDDGYLIWGKWL